MPFEKELEFALAMARRSGEVALRIAAGVVAEERKKDDSPVTVADRECERIIAAALEDSFPLDGLLGEEGALKESRSGRRWIVDPIDGTRDFLRGTPTWSVLIGLEADGDAVAGVCHLPALGESYVAARGAGTWCGGRRLQVSGVSRLDQAVVCVNSLHVVNRYAWGEKLLGWLAGAWAVRSFGGCMDAMLIASGRADAWIEPVAASWDLCALKIIIEEAGGRFFNFDGGSSIHGGDGLACTPGLEAELRRAFTKNPGQ